MTESAKTMDRVEREAMLRAGVLAIARAEIGVATPEKLQRYFSDCGLVYPRDKSQWCGIFALSCLLRAGVAPKGTPWIPGPGFLFHLKTTTDPKPGDILYIDEPFRHHALFVSRSSDRATVDSIDGNQPGIAARRRGHPAAVYYSIQRWIDAVLDAEDQAAVRAPQPTIPDSPSSKSADSLRALQYVPVTHGDRDPKGSTDGPVRCWQKLLLAAGFKLPRWGADGDFGDETAEATRQLQASRANGKLVVLADFNFAVEAAARKAAK